LLAATPAILAGPTELGRRQSSLAITLLHSRAPGSDRIALCAPDGPGTIPGGAAAMQSPDFWSIAFGPPQRDPGSPLFDEVLNALTGGAAGPGAAAPRPLDESLGPWLTTNLEPGWLPLRDHVRACVALGILSIPDIAAAAGVAVGALHDAFGVC